MRPSLLLTVLLAAPAAADDWPRFRGPNGTGTSAGKGLPLRWSDGAIRYRVGLSGVGHSSPVVVGGRVFLLSATRGERLVLCHDARTGKELWSKAIPGGVGRTHPKSSLASATPCSDGRRLFCSFWDGRRVTLHAFDLDGKALWTRDLGAFTSQHGPGFSPVVADGKVIVNLDQDGSAALLAFDAPTGKPRWRVERPAFRACYSTPFLRGRGADEHLVVASTAGITGYTLGGKQLWNYEWSFPGKPLRTVGSPVEAGGLIVACSGDGSGDRDMVAVRPGSAAGRSELVWRKDSGTPYVPTLVAHGGHLYGVNDSGIALCYEAKTGKEEWSGRVCGSVSASPVLIEGKVLVVDERGKAVFFAADPKGLRVLARNDLGEAVYATPAVADGRLYVRTTHHLVAVGKKEKP